MGRSPHYRRAELYFDPTDETWAAVVAEATVRQVSLQTHLFDILRARHLARHGQRSLADLLWMPTSALSAAPPAPLEADQAAAGGDPGAKEICDRVDAAIDTLLCGGMFDPET